MTSDVVTRILGILLFAGLMVAFARLLLRLSRQAGVLRAVVVGVALRLGVTAGTHLASVASGNGGFFYLDDRYYARSADALASAWASGHLPRPWDEAYTGSYSYGYSLLVGFTKLLTGDAILAGKAVNVLLAGALILLSAQLAGVVLGPAGARRTAWMVALLPSLWWWSSPLMKEQLSACLMLTALLAAAGAWRSNGLGVGISSAALAIVRPPAAVAALAGLAASRAPGIRTSIREAGRSGAIVTLLVVLGITAGAFALSGGQLGVAGNQLTESIESMIGAYREGGLLLVPVDVIRAFVAPYPWVFDVSANWDFALYPGNWLLICLYPTVLVGMWRLRGRRDVLLLLTVPILVLLTINAITSGTVVRQRSSIEPLLAILAVVGWTSSRAVLSRAAIALSITAVLAGVQSRSPLVFASVLFAAAAAHVLARRMTAGDGRTLAITQKLGPALTRHELQATALSAYGWMESLTASAPRAARADSAAGALGAGRRAVLQLRRVAPGWVPRAGRGDVAEAPLAVLRARRLGAVDASQRLLQQMRRVAPSAVPCESRRRLPVSQLRVVLPFVTDVAAVLRGIAPMAQPISSVHSLSVVSALRNGAPRAVPLRRPVTPELHIPTPIDWRIPRGGRAFRTAASAVSDVAVVLRGIAPMAQPISSVHSLSVVSALRNGAPRAVPLRRPVTPALHIPTSIDWRIPRGGRAFRAAASAAPAPRPVVRPEGLRVLARILLDTAPATDPSPFTELPQVVAEVRRAAPRSWTRLTTLNNPRISRALGAARSAAPPIRLAAIPIIVQALAGAVRRAVRRRARRTDN